jgi:hypothetical protein
MKFDAELGRKVIRIGIWVCRAGRSGRAKNGKAGVSGYVSVHKLLTVAGFRVRFLDKQAYLPGNTHFILRFDSHNEGEI